MDKNPCIGCNLENEDKNSRTCVECSDRVNYVSGLGGMTHSVPVEKTDLVGVPFMGTRNEKGTHKGMPLHMVTQKGRAAVKPQAKTGENKMTILKEKIEDTIEKICAEVSVSVANLRAGRRGRKYTVARKKIAERLIANYGMTQRKIGELTGVSNQAIGYLLSKNPSSPSATPRQALASPKATQGMPCIAKGDAGQEKTTDAVDILHKRYIGDDPKRKASLRAERENAEGKESNPTQFDAVFSRIKEALQVETETAVAKYLGIKQSSIAGARKRNQIPPGWIVTFSEQYGISADWLLYGIEMVSRNEKHKIIKSKNHDHLVSVDFSGHAEILEHLGKHAKEEIRSVPDQILYFIQTSLSWVEGEAERLQE